MDTDYKKASGGVILGLDYMFRINKAVSADSRVSFRNAGSASATVRPSDVLEILLDYTPAFSFFKTDEVIFEGKETVESCIIPFTVGRRYGKDISKKLMFL